MALTENERGALLSSMSDGTVAALLRKSLIWVRCARSDLRAEVEADRARWNKLGKPETPEPIPKFVGSPAEAVPIPNADAGPVQIVPLAAPEPTVESPPIYSEAIPAPPPAPVVILPPARFGAPADLKGLELAEWLYDNSPATFECIAKTAGVTVQAVQRIADGEAPVVASRPPAPCAGPSVRDAKRDTPPDDTEIPPRVIRWARWFVNARWHIATIAGLFDVPEDALRAALR